jgi:hypothetical protein
LSHGGRGFEFGFRLRVGLGHVLVAADGRWREGLEADLEAVDHLARAAGVDGVLGEAMEDGGEGDEDGGAVLDGGQLHAGDLGVDEDVVGAFGVLEVVVIAVVLAFERGRAATLAGWGLVMVTLLVATKVWNWLWHGVPPLGIDFSHDLPNKPLTGQLILQETESKGVDLQDLENAGVMVSLELWETQA